MIFVLGVEISRVTVFLSGEAKTVTPTVAVPKTKIVKQQTPPQTTPQTTPKDTERTDFTPIRPQPPLPNQRNQ